MARESEGREITPHAPRLTRLAPGRKLGSFASVVSQTFILSGYLPETNARRNWLRFGAFLVPPATALWSQRPLTTIVSPLATRSSPVSRISPLTTGHPATAAGRKLGSFARAISRSFILSHNVPVTNARENWLRFGAFLAPPAPSLRVQRPLTTIFSPLATRHSPLRLHWPLFSRHSPLAAAQANCSASVRYPAARAPPFRLGGARDSTLLRIVQDHPHCSPILILR